MNISQKKKRIILFPFFCVNSNVNRRLIYVWNRVSSGREFPYVYYTQSMCYARILSPTTTLNFYILLRKSSFPRTSKQVLQREREKKTNFFVCFFVSSFFLVGCTIKIKMRFFYVCVYVFFGFFSLSLLNVGADLSNLCT